MNNIMIVEDEALIALSLQNKLEKLGYGVPTIAHTGEEAVEEAAKCNPDLILMDINLRGEMTGTTAAERIRSHQQVPIIFLTAYSDDSTLQQAKKADPFGYILKPYKDGELRAAIEMALHKHQKEVEEVTKTKALAEDSNKLGRLNESLYEKNENKDKLFSIISHDLSGNAGRIDSLLFILTTSPDYEGLPQGVKDIIRMAKENARINKSLIEDLLLWARNQFDGIEFNPVPVLVHEITDRVETQMRPYLEARHISFNRQIPADIELPADINMLVIIIRNLVSNAIKFSNEGSEISLAARKENGRVTIELRDQGVGISEENLAKLFNKNIVFSTYGTKGEKGTGFGLELCYDFVSRHNGKIEVESELGKGSTFRVVLPAKQETK